jgi:hypothetical protein
VIVTSPEEEDTLSPLAMLTDPERVIEEPLDSETVPDVDEDDDAG